MIEIQGKYNKAKVFTNNIEGDAYKQILNLMNQKFAEGSNIAVMPDCHAGAGCVIGLTMTLVDRVVPNLVGVDIGCGMLVFKVDKSFNMDLKLMDEIWHNEIPSGMNHRETKHDFANGIPLEDIIAPINAEKLRYSIGTLGGGNHFGEVDVDEDGDYYIVIHSGSRHLGVEICRYYQDLAVKYHKEIRIFEQDIIDRLKKQGREKEIEKELARFRSKKGSVPNELAYLVGSQMDDYLHDMDIAQRYASLNRMAMMKTITDIMRIPITKVKAQFCTIHNYIDIEQKILRKGSISLLKGERAIIPMNMRDGSLIVEGKGNPEWNFSGPHGAGRRMSRSMAKRHLSLDVFKLQMEGIYSTCIGWNTIDESPSAYKPMEEIVSNIKETADIVKVIKPIYNFKAEE